MSTATKKTTLICTLLVLFLGLSTALEGQSLLDNEFYRKARDLMTQSQQALDNGDYDGAARLAAQAKEQLSQSDQYVATASRFYIANGWLNNAKDRIAYAKSIQADVNYKDQYDSAVQGEGLAQSALDDKDYDRSTDLSKGVLAILKDVAPKVAEVKPAPEEKPVEKPAVKPAVQPAEAPAGPPPLPQYYTARLILPLRDCFWRIAGYPFVYDNPWKWRLLYEANKSLLEDPNNPDLIEVGARFLIPPLAGETREGDFDPSVSYPPLK
jgi:nucleoid-associated protein YgaU